MAKSKRINSTAAYTAEFHHEFRAETGRLLRKRFLWFTGVVGALGVLSLTGGVVAKARGVPTRFGGGEGLLDNWVFWFFSLAWLALYLGGFLFVLRKRPRDSQVLRLSTWLVVIDAMLNINMSVMGVQGASPLSGFFLTHFLACLFLPWTPAQALKPAVMVLSVHAAALLLSTRELGAVSGVMGAPESEPRTLLDAGLLILASLMLPLPGALWCWIRHSKRTQEFKLRFMSTRYSEMRRELVDARKIHESLFPSQVEQGPLRFTFDYEPMRQIGGDFLFAHRLRGGNSGDGPLSVVLLDVTGHGIPAALTVNRLHGELERIFAENPDVGPGEVLALLNRYVHLTLSSHSIYVTALCLRVDTDASTLEFASGGHPPAFLRAVDGTVEELISTSFVLGAASYADYDPAPRTLRFGPGDTVLAYTDGAIEARNEAGQMVRIDGLRRMVASAGEIHPTKWPQAFRNEVTEFRGGPAEDDTLMLVVHRVLGDRVRKPEVGVGAVQVAEG